MPLNIHRFLIRGLLLSTLVGWLLSSVSIAADGEPLAVRTWPNGVVSIENHWGLKLFVSTHANHQTTMTREASKSISLIDPLDHVLSRLPNQPKPVWRKASEIQTIDPNAMTIQSVGSNSLRVNVDGVVVLIASNDFKAANVLSADSVDVMILTNVHAEQLTSEPIAKIVRSANPRYLIPLNASSPDSTVSNRTRHNTLAVSAADKGQQETQTVLLGPSPWEMSNELAALFTEMEQSCSQSQKVFAELSTSQMNFKPSNQTHTPRWNAEHMMGRQLQFFSQIYHAIDSNIPVMNLNPQQMPLDYRFAHPDWDGAEEARQMQRVSDFCRRFAYLLDGMDIDKKAPGSRWPSLRALLVQMQKHYQEHTANTVKKFELPDFPKP
ncbi:hypothetical protein CA13_15950 [Planctomycetes bacterium CA13]|uniref:DinB superfamily protein n=1 Tax=Novipirellula herctigrandis TaxID=2527986 RepID=A0A5C5YYN8_9BACT|nr:hypothetical protein CA13_15950 [Planctomycetes bacterium CA13]